MAPMVDKSWKSYKKLLRRGVLLVCVITITVFLLVNCFSYTKFSTFYQIIKKKLCNKLHNYLRL